jgi:hypothetical protein
MTGRVDGSAVHAFMRRMPVTNLPSAYAGDPAAAYHRVDGAPGATIHPQRVQPSTLRKMDVAP